MSKVQIYFASNEHLRYVQDICSAIEEAAKDKKSGLALRTPDYITEKINSGKGVIALDGDKFVGFCYIESWEHCMFVAHSGLIVKPEYRGLGLAKEIKHKAFELTAHRFPKAKVFGLTTSPAVMKINEELGYRAVPYNQITSDINFWKGCVSCTHYETLCKNGFESCNCTGMVFDPQKHFLKILDFTPEEIRAYLDLAIKLKADKKAGKELQLLKGKNVAILFEKASTRTRCAFEVAASDQGGYATYLGSVGSHLGIDESMDDTARVMGRMFDGIAYRGFGQNVVERIAELAGVPVWNALTNEAHPTQTLADLMTIIEHAGKPLNEVAIAFLGDTHCNTCNSLFAGCVKMGMDFRAVGPRSLQPSDFLQEECRKVAQKTGARITITDDVDAGVNGCDFIYTDVWVSMGEPAEIWDERVALLRPYRVDSVLMSKTGNPDCKFMHCLPSYHDTSIKAGRELKEKYGLDGIEVTHEVFESKNSIVFDEAENRMHTIKAVMVHSLSK